MESPIQSLYRQRLEYTNYIDPIPVLVIKPSEPIQGTTEFYGAPASFGSPFPTTGIEGKLVVASPMMCCEKIDPLPSGSILLVERGICTFLEKIKNAQDAGAAAVVVISIFRRYNYGFAYAKDSQSGALFTMAADGPSVVNRKGIQIPSLLVSLEDGHQLKRFARDQKSIYCNSSLKMTS
jgi:hypothetical protein